MDSRERVLRPQSSVPALARASRSAIGLSLLFSFCCFGACGEPEPFTPASLRVIGPPELVGGECPSANQVTYGPLEFTDETPSTVRLTYLRPGTSNDDTDARLLCDIVVDYGAPPPYMAVPGEELVDLSVEFFAASGELMAAGLAHNVDLSSQATIDIRAAPLGQYTCGNGQLNTPRAFHSAAVLPDGRVVIAGGAITSLANPSDRDVDLNAGMYLTNSVEIFDPATGLFTPMQVPDLVPRAMHNSYAWTDGTDMFVALVGGFTLQDVTQPAIVPNQDGLRWAPALAARGTATEVLVLSADGSITRVEGPGDVPAVMSGHSEIEGDRQIHVGGQQWVPDPMTMTNVLAGIDEFSVTDTVNWVEDVPPTPLLQARRGATVTQIGGGRALVWGGHLEADAFQMLPYAGEMITGLNGQNMPASVAISYSGDTPIPRALHQAVQLGAGILIVGGFNITNGTARTTAADLVELIDPGNSQSTSVNVTTVATADGSPPTPAGYLGILHLSSGDVLVNGGNPFIGYGDCNMAQDGIMCSIGDSYMFRENATALERMPGTLLKGRYGHQLVELAGGRVLVTGGLHAPAPSPALEMVATAEILDTRSTGIDALSPGLDRAPGQVATTADGEPLATCKIIENVAPAE